MRIVVADDSPILRKKHGQFLRSLGHTVSGFASDGQEAVDVCRNVTPSAVLLDLNMPAKPGDEIVGGIEALHALKGFVPNIFVLTSNTAESVLSPLREHAYIIKKPICDAETLGMHIDRGLKQE